MFKPVTGTTQTQLKFKTTIIPHVHISATALDKMQVYVNEMADEIGWLGTTRREGNDIYIEDVFLFRQQVHGTTTEITPEGLEEFGMEILQRPDGMDLWNSMKMWGHSHVNMSVTPSGQDNTQMADFERIGHDYFVRLIANKKGDMRIDVYEYDKGLEFHQVPWNRYEVDNAFEVYEEQISSLELQIQSLRHTIATAHDERIAGITADIKEEIKEKVSKLVVQTYSYGGAGAHGGNFARPKPLGTVNQIDGVRQTIASFFTGKDLDSLAYYCKTYNDLLDDLDQLGLLDTFTYQDCSKVWTEVLAIRKEFNMQ